VSGRNEPFRTLRARTLVLAQENIDTDQIIPARFLTTTERQGLGRHLFADWRYAADGTTKPDSPLDRPEARQARVVVAGHNFGCGSSREHAVWALHDFGFRAVVSSGLADIFRRNALKNGLLAFEIGAAEHARLLAASGAEIAIDLESLRLTLPDGETVPFAIDPFSRHCLLEGVDELEFLLAQEGEIARYEARSARAEVMR
jgi:3-isopropylmalate/(R)-2-methylmalate dehydratase small subunit